MPVYQITRYPVEASLSDGGTVTLRPMTREDGSALLEFFRGVPAEDRFLLKEDVTSPAVINSWVEHLDYDRILSLLAVVDGQVVGDATLIRRRGGARSHTGEIRAVVAPAYRHKGLATLMIKELATIAYDAELDKVIFELVSDVHAGTMHAIEALGAVHSGTVTDMVKDMHGQRHDLVYLSLPLGKNWEWNQL